MRTAFITCMLVLGCAEPIAPLRPSDPVAEPFVCDPASPPPSERLTWKRASALANDLSRALDLAPGALCTELDRRACTDVHRVALGGNDPFGAGQYAPAQSALATTPAALDRLVLSACENAVAGSPGVFASLPPTDRVLDEAADRVAIDAQITVLYRRLLARDPEPGEMEIVRGLARTPQHELRTTRELDVLACFAIGTTSEMVLF